MPASSMMLTRENFSHLTGLNRGNIYWTPIMRLKFISIFYYIIITTIRKRGNQKWCILETNASFFGNKGYQNRALRENSLCGPHFGYLLIIKKPETARGC